MRHSLTSHLECRIPVTDSSSSDQNHERSSSFERVSSPNQLVSLSLRMLNSNPSHTLTRTLIQYGARPAKRRCLSTHRSSIPQPPYKILFFGADNFSCVTLETLYESRKGKPQARALFVSRSSWTSGIWIDLIQHLVVVTPPDQKTGRRLKEIHRREFSLCINVNAGRSSLDAIFCFVVLRRLAPLRLLAETLSLPSIALPPSLLKDWTVSHLTIFLHLEPRPFDWPSFSLFLSFHLYQPFLSLLANSFLLPLLPILRCLPPYSWQPLSVTSSRILYYHCFNLSILSTCIHLCYRNIEVQLLYNGGSSMAMRTRIGIVIMVWELPYKSWVEVNLIEVGFWVKKKSSVLSLSPFISPIKKKHRELVSG